MSLYNGPARGGTRGGKDQFKWDDVKSDKDRECYLGHSVMAPVGRWQKNKDILWYTRSKEDHAAEMAKERKAVKEHEDQLMREALGLAPKRDRTVRSKMDQKEMDEMLRRGGGDADGEGDDKRDADRMKGIGSSTRIGMIGGQGGGFDREVLPGVEADAGPGPRGGEDGAADRSVGENSSDSDSSQDRKASKKRKKEERKEKKKKKKEDKMRKKEEKREKKRQRQNL
eukprot:CAMPEP_0114232450 /NCGR_PEP_ID=MMETSP0058-20121206/4614_1 /TAXON_ID=36894 /ORGANISM="Pyramimonas parkeae, CCMP726" /LENGTH=226 /DNA_ID=CAMNT_0001343927 /DNA_START=39 /DNA_END=719 /DNA_ORIENTATION=+